MSLTYKKSSGRIRIVSFAVLGAGGLLFAASSFVPMSGAYFSDAKQADVSVRTGALGLELTSDTGPVSDDGILRIALDGLKPGESITERITARNTGRSTGDLAVYTDGLGAMGGRDTGLMHLELEGYGTVPEKGVAPALELGRLDNGYTQPLIFTVSLDRSAGNEWQDTTATYPVHVTLQQPR